MQPFCQLGHAVAQECRVTQGADRLQWLPCRRDTPGFSGWGVMTHSACTGAQKMCGLCHQLAALLETACALRCCVCAQLCRVPATPRQHPARVCGNGRTAEENQWPLDREPMDLFGAPHQSLPPTRARSELGADRQSVLVGWTLGRAAHLDPQGFPGVAVCYRLATCCITAFHRQSRVCWLQLSARVVAFFVVVRGGFGFGVRR